MSGSPTGRISWSEILNPWKKISETLVREGRWRLLLRRFDRGHGRTAEFEIRELRDVACVVAVTERNTVLIAMQFRPGTEDIVMDLPGGGIEPGEPPETAIRRELLEETGYAPATLKFLAANPVSAYSTNRRHCFVATGCRKVGEPTPDEQEDIEVVELTMDEFRNHLRSGNLTDVGAGYLALDALNRL